MHDAAWGLGLLCHCVVAAADGPFVHFWLYHLGYPADRLPAPGDPRGALVAFLWLVSAGGLADWPLGHHDVPGVSTGRLSRVVASGTRPTVLSTTVGVSLDGLAQRCGEAWRLGREARSLRRTCDLAAARVAATGLGGDVVLVEDTEKMAAFSAALRTGYVLG
jgi:hypothetical protein